MVLSMISGTVKLYLVCSTCFVDSSVLIALSGWLISQEIDEGGNTIASPSSPAKIHDMSFFEYCTQSVKKLVQASEMIIPAHRLTSGQVRSSSSSMFALESC